MHNILKKREHLEKTALTDLIILGAGPAGLALAINAKKSGANITLIERNDFIHPRPGDHFSGQTRRAMHSLSVPVSKFRKILSESPGISSLWGTEMPVTKPYSGQASGTGLNASRTKFDHALWNHALENGVIGSLETRIDSAERQKNSWVVKVKTGEGDKQLRADTIIDATGRGAWFARRQGAKIKKAGDLYATVSWYKETNSSAPPSSALSLEATERGWWTLTRTPGENASTAFYSSRALLKIAKSKPEDWKADSFETAPFITNRLLDLAPEYISTQTFACAPAVSDKMYGPGWLAIGEAAAAFDPICGQGVTYAMESAFRAFELISADAGITKLGPLYQEAMTSKATEHLERRRDVYLEAEHKFDPQFLTYAVLPGFPKI